MLKKNFSKSNSTLQPNIIFFFKVSRGQQRGLIVRHSAPAARTCTFYPRTLSRLWERWGFIVWRNQVTVTLYMHVHIIICILTYTICSWFEHKTVFILGYKLFGTNVFLNFLKYMYIVLKMNGYWSYVIVMPLENYWHWNISKILDFWIKCF